MDDAQDFYNPRDKYYKQFVSKRTPASSTKSAPLNLFTSNPSSPSVSFREFSAGVANSPQAANTALNRYRLLAPESAERIKKFTGQDYVPGRVSAPVRRLPAPASIPTVSSAFAETMPYLAERPTAIVPRVSGTMVPASDVIEGQFTKVAPKSASIGAKALPLVGDALVGTMYGAETGSVGRGIAAGLGSFAGRTVGGVGGALTGPAAPVAVPVLSVGGSIAGAEGAAQLYDYLTAGQPPESMNMSPGVQQALLNGAPAPASTSTSSGGAGLDPGTAELLARAGVGFAAPPPTAPPSVPKLAKPTDAEQVEHGTTLQAFYKPEIREEMRRQNVFPGETTTPGGEFNPRAQVRKAEPVEKPSSKPVEKPTEFKGPSETEMKRFRTLTGTKYDKNSITDKLNLERMRAGEQTMTSKQSRQWRNENPSYRPGMYSRMKK